MSKGKKTLEKPKTGNDFLAGVSGSAFKIRIIDNRLGLSGQNIQFKNEDFFGLKVGQKVVQVGDGRENGSFRTDSFKYPVKYVGSVMCQFSKAEKLFAFQLPDKINDEDVFLLYGSTGEEIFTEGSYSKKRKLGYMRFYVPVFFLS